MSDNKGYTNAEVPDLVKGISLTPVLTSILKPSADLLGSELRDVLKAGIDKLKASRQSSNLRAHIEEVKRELGVSAEKFAEIRSVEQLELFEDWVEGAAKIDPEEEELARLWQKMLAEIVQNRKPSRILLERAKQLVPEDAKLLLKVGRRFPGVFFGTSGPHLDRLSSLGFVSENRSLVPLASVLMWVGSFLFFLRQVEQLPQSFAVRVFFQLFFGATTLKELEVSTILVVGLVLSSIIGAIVFLSLRDSVKILRLTGLGRQLASFARRSRTRRRITQGLKRTPNGAA